MTAVDHTSTHKQHWQSRHPINLYGGSASPQNKRFRIVRATENILFSPAPRYTFSRGDELSSDKPNTPRKRASLAEGDGGLFFFACVL